MEIENEMPPESKSLSENLETNDFDNLDRNPSDKTDHASLSAEELERIIPFE